MIKQRTDFWYEKKFNFMSSSIISPEVSRGDSGGYFCWTSGGAFRFDWRVFTWFRRLMWWAGRVDLAGWELAFQRAFIVFVNARLVATGKDIKFRDSTSWGQLKGLMSLSWWSILEKILSWYLAISSGLMLGREDRNSARSDSGKGISVAKLGC